MRRISLLVLFAALIAGCPMPPSRAATMQEAASDTNLNARFGRMELAMENVAPEAREPFMKHRKEWGQTVRVVDYELIGAGLTGENEANVSVRVSWFRPEEQDLRTTTLHQRWTDAKGGWKLTSEERFEGDLGLLGDAPPRAEGEIAPRAHAQFPTIRLGE